MIFMFPYFLLNGKLSQVGPLRGKFCQPNCICSQICIFSHVSTACLHMECNKMERERMVKLRSGVTMARWKRQRPGLVASTLVFALSLAQHFHVAVRRQGHLDSLLIKCFGWKPFLHVVACTSLQSCFKFGHRAQRPTNM